MKANIYDLLNDIETDLDIYETEQLSEVEKKQREKSIRKKISGNKSKTRKIKCFVTAAAACASVVIIVGVANPSLADTLYSKASELLIGQAEGSKYEEEDKTLYQSVGKTAEAPEETKDAILTATAEGVDISIEDIYCDGYYLYYTLRLTSDREDINNSEWISTFGESAKMTGETNLGPVMRLNGQDIDGDGNQSLLRAEDGSFVVLGNIDLNYYREEMGYDIPEKDQIVIDYQINELSGSISEHTEDGEYVKSADVIGEWNLRFAATADTSKNITKEYNLEENGIQLKKATRTSANMIVEVELPDMTKAPYNDPHNDPALLLLDSEGNDIPWSTVYVKQLENGKSYLYMTCMHTEAEALKVQVINKNVDNALLAEIDFEI